MATEEAVIAAIFETVRRNCAENGAPLALVKEFAAYVHPALFKEEVMDAFERADLRRAKREA
ncbi:hypothetical protein OH738_34570 [Streptomyces hirsutus]|uniref:Uncharacterized protein n=1 Tax=Streptomyces hirsutus TaxID=35620 RepID=A0ABZ1GJ19_9ACTN|nr:hypothetical protein [Streptomyces hirsutus]WSD05230.1 hypothetical protein OIE73_05310 [Streptomyces hirsutus]WTD21376.1 hypothetical protein OH738_34570 [Streptomyces hirsutus]